MADGITYRWLTEADLKEIVRRETETLRALLVEARKRIDRAAPTSEDATSDDCMLLDRIDTALAAMTEKP